ncbi:MAG: acyltransferase [Nitrospina sp.]|jgi:galactoside O-acetyltransferase|nr:acyltransferase [Nitrospina sp.]
MKTRAAYGLPLLKKILLRSINVFFWARLFYSALIKTRLKRCGKGTRFRLTTFILGYENIVVGDNLNTMGFLYLYANDNGFLEIGNDCSFNSNIQIGAAGGKIIIGNQVMIASNVVIRAANHGMQRNTPMRIQQHDYGEIIIEDDVWIGSNSVITSNITIAKGTVVGAGAVVTKSTEPYSIVGGIPARKIGERI